MSPRRTLTPEPALKEQRLEIVRARDLQDADVDDLPGGVLDLVLKYNARRVALDIAVDGAHREEMEAISRRLQCFGSTSHKYDTLNNANDISAAGFSAASADGSPNPTAPHKVEILHSAVLVW